MWVYDDGGRLAAGLHGQGNDCAVRAIAIATGGSYLAIYNDLAPHIGVYRQVWQPYLENLGFVWHIAMEVGHSARVRVRDLPQGIVVAMLRGHICTIIDGVVHDTFDHTKDGAAVVYGYMTRRES